MQLSCPCDVEPDNKITNSNFEVTKARETHSILEKTLLFFSVNNNTIKLKVS